MKATVERNRLNRALRRLSAGVGTVAPLIVQTMPDALELLAVGRDSIMCARVGALVEKAGAAELTVKQMGSVVKTLPNGQVALRVDTQGVALSSGGARVVLAESDELCGAELPELPESQRLIEIDGEVLRSAMSGVIPSAATDNHPIFGSVRFDDSDGVLRVVASDTFRLAVRDLPQVPAIGTFSVSARSIKRMLRALGKPSRYRVGIDHGYVWFGGEGLGTMGIVGDWSEYPRYRGWAPPWQARINCARDPLLDLADRVVALDKKSPAAVKLVFATSEIKFVAKSAVGMVSGSLQAERHGLSEEVTLRFNSLFLADALANLRSDQVEIRLAEDPLSRPKPVLIADGLCPEAWNLVMPMRAG